MKWQLWALSLGVFVINPNWGFADENQTSIELPAEVQHKVVGVRIDDFVNVHPKTVAGLVNLQVSIKDHIKDIFNDDKVETVHSIFFLKKPQLQASLYQVELGVFLKYEKRGFYFEKLIVQYAETAKRFEDFSFQREVIAPLNQLKFKAEVGLVDRKLIITELTKNFQLVFPIGVGSFDEGVLNEGKVSLITPRFKQGFLDKSAVISKREKPRYFKGKPFIRLLNGPSSNDDRTPIGFHIEINDSFVRGFDSHGCMRLREMDLMAFHDLIMFGSDKQIPITVNYRTENLSDSPILKRNKIYKTILNKGTEASPFFILDRDLLVQTTMKEAQAPVEKLIDEEKDHYEDVFNYDTNSQMKEQDERRKNECQAKVMNGQIKSDEKSFQACLDEGKRKETMADRIYRKMMGIDSISFDLD